MASFKSGSWFLQKCKRGKTRGRNTTVISLSSPHAQALHLLICMIGCYVNAAVSLRCKPEAGRTCGCLATRPDCSGCCRNEPRWIELVILGFRRSGRPFIGPSRTKANPNPLVEGMCALMKSSTGPSHLYLRVTLPMVIGSRLLVTSQTKAGHRPLRVAEALQPPLFFFSFSSSPAFSVCCSIRSGSSWPSSAS